MPGTTAIPFGRGTKVRSKTQSDFLTPASGGDAVERNTYRHNSDISREFADDDVLGSNGLNNSLDSRPAAPGLEDGSFSCVWPLDLTQIGYGLTELLGSPTSTGSGPYQHVFSSASQQLPLTTLERELGPTRFRLVASAVARQMVFPFGPGAGYQEVRAEYLARQVTDPYGASVFSSPTVLALAARAPKSVATLKIDGVTSGRLISGGLTVTNNLGSDRYNGDRLLSDIWKQGVAAELEAQARYADDTFPNLSVVGADGYLPDAHAVSLEYVLNSSLKLVLAMPAVRIMPISVPVEGGDAVTIQIRGRAEVSAGAPMLTATLTNARASYAS